MAKERKRRKHGSDSDDDESPHRRSKSRKKSKHSSDDSDDASNLSSSDDEDRRHRRKRRERKDKDKKKRRKEKRKKKHERRKHGRRKDSSEDEDEDAVAGSVENNVSPKLIAQDILDKFPALSGEFKQLLQMVDSGQGVDISDIPDENLRALLYKLFESLSLTKVDRVYLLPEGSQPTVETLAEVLKDISEQPDLTQQTNGTTNELEEDGSHGIGPAERPPAPPPAPGPRIKGPAMPTPDMLEAAARLTEAEEALRKAEEELDQDPFIGPPPPAMVAEAESVNEAERFEEVARILDPDLKNAYEKLGVKPDATAESIKKRYWKLSLLVHPDKCSHPQAHEAFTTINKAFQELQDPTKRAAIDYMVAERKRKEEEEVELRSLREAAQWRRLRGEIALVGDDELLGTGPKAPSRDEWMMKLPPERKVGGPPSMHSTFFSKTEKTGRGDTSAWTDTPLEKAQKAKMQYLEAYKQAALPAAQQADTSAAEAQKASEIAKVVDKYNEKRRSESLVDKHKRDTADKKKSKKNEVVEDWVGKHPWKPWDRETDLAAGRKSVKLDAASMAKGLDSRFGSSGGQRKFL